MMEMGVYTVEVSGGALVIKEGRKTHLTVPQEQAREFAYTVLNALDAAEKGID